MKGDNSVVVHFHNASGTRGSMAGRARPAARTYKPAGPVHPRHVM